ncbi:phosphatase PAP2 family protein [Ohtaekwangia koreensis]|uniref:Undecaprenyl-diphosphatase n=1 Tax=Ohtaekwangia koreensis TaxID=688867 RepID=A0A1T5JNC6_9BACT|nr:phosphatase PAP2 family protein [Ohtaekwangia koreensis]SKC52874.1 undecaprenyl-diphosphatase [Ohtaekwangia koreensis]
METLIELDKKLMIFLNGFHTPWLDPVILFATQTLTWLPLYAFLVYLIIKEYRREVWMALIAIAITIVLADQITSGLMKPYFERFRPSHEPSLEGLLHFVTGPDGKVYKGGLYGFASSHAANTFGAAAFFFFLLRKTRKWIGVLFVWALFVAYTRIYLGVHYPGDILVGGLIGVGCGWIGYRVYKLLHHWFGKKQLESA